MYRRIAAEEEKTKNRYKLPDPNTNFLINLLKTQPPNDDTFSDNN